ncbi:MAG: hypothetical protein OXL96_21220 [Candidatus Poribacteria bacterium]|nr:hypothetical protein [Candidatus Poribacteria bacterium]
MFLRKYWLPISVFIVAIAGIGLYLLATQPPKDPIVIYKPVEPLPKSKAKAPVGETSQGGHVHADGTWHEGPHDTPPETRQRDTTAAENEIEFSPNLTKEEYTKLKAINKDLESNIAERRKLQADIEKVGAEKQEVYNQINALFDTPQRTAEDETQIIALLNRVEELKAVVKRTTKTRKTLETTGDTFVAEMRQIAKGERVRKDE